MEELFFYNPWWKEDFTEEIAFRREAFERILDYIEKTDRIVIVKGPRRVGKTTLMYQLISHLLKQGTNPKTILYISFDDPKLRKDFDKILDFYKTEILKSGLQSGKIYIFLDEVQFLENWQYSVKKYYDRKMPIKFVVSGSSATLIKKGSESLMGRTIEETMLPFSFAEFFEYKTGSHAEIDAESMDIFTVKKYEEQAKIFFSEYMERGGFPNLFGIDTKLIPKLLREDVVEKALYRDIVALYDIKKPEILEKLFIYLVNSTAQTVNTSNIAKYLELSRQYVSKYVTYLKNAYFFIALEKYSRSAGKTARSAEKIYCIDPAMINTFLSGEFEHESGHIVESIVARHLFGKDVYYWKNHREVDFVIKQEGGLLPIEVKYKNAYSDKDLSGLLEFCKKYKTKSAILVTKDLFEKKHVNGVQITLIPIWVFTLSTYE